MKSIHSAGRWGRGAALFAVVLAALVLGGCQSNPSQGRGGNYIEVFPGTGMPEFPDGGSA